MAEADFVALNSSLAAGVIRRGVTSAITPPTGGGSFTYGWSSAQSGQQGAHGLIYNALPNFNPTPANSGGRCSGALKRRISAGRTGFSPFLIIGGQGPDISDNAYLFGLQDDDPSRIVLRKGAISLGIPSGIVGENGILRVSTDDVSEDEWVHLRIDMVVNGTGDTILQMFRNTASVATPTWTAIAGMDDFTDDVLGDNSGSLPYTSSRFGFGFEMSDISRRGAVDFFQCARQL